MKVRASRIVTRDDVARMIVRCVLYGDMPFDKKLAIMANNNWRKLHGIHMKRGWRKLEW